MLEFECRIMIIREEERQVGGGSRERLVNGYNVIVRLGKIFPIFCYTQITTSAMCISQYL